VAVVAEPMLSRHAEHLADTKAGLITAARELFGTRGYADTSVVDIAARARLTPGALFHHFGSKPALFTVVLEQVEEEFITRLADAGAPGETLWEEIGNGCQSFLDVAMDPEIQRIMLHDGPIVLGWAAWREIEERYGFGLLRKFLGRAMDWGFLPVQPLDPLVYLLSGALNETAMYIAHAPDRDRARTEMGDALARVLGRLGQTPTGTAERLTTPTIPRPSRARHPATGAGAGKER